MECITVRNIPRHFDHDFTRLSLYRVFSPFGSIASVQLLEECAIVAYQSSESAQAAYVHRNGYPLFGSQIAVMIGISSVPALTHFSITDAPTSTILVQGVERLWLSLHLRHWKGVEDCLLVGTVDTLVKCSSANAASSVINGLNTMRGPTGEPLSAHYVKRVRVLVS